jgi:hypothetical protein
MMLYDLALVQDRGPNWFVTNVTKNTLDNLADKEEKILKLSAVSYEIISEALKNGKKVFIEKNMLTNEVLPFEVNVVENDENDILEDTKNSSIIKIRMLVTPELAKISSFSLYGFTVLNNDLASSGYFITNANREEKYLEILETGDEELISKLEDYLNYKDEIETIASLERKFSKFKSDLNNCNSVEEVKKVEEIFLENFYSNF